MLHKHPAASKFDNKTVNSNCVCSFGCLFVFLII